MKKILLATSILLLAASCNNSNQAQNNQNNGSNTSQAQVTACTSTDLNGTASVQGASGALAGWIEVKNVSNDQCALSNASMPGLTLYSGTAVLSAQNQKDNANLNGQDMTLAPGQTIRVYFVWNNFCGTRPSQPLLVVLTLPGNSDTMTIPLTNADGSALTTVPRCDNRKSGATLNIGNFVPMGSDQNSSQNQGSSQSNKPSSAKGASISPSAKSNNSSANTQPQMQSSQTQSTQQNQNSMQNNQPTY